MTTARVPPLKSLDLSLRVIEAMDAPHAERGVSDLARELRVSKATIYRILATLEARGYVVQDPTSVRYRIGPRLRQFGQNGPARLDLPALARPFMIELRDQTRENIHLAVLDGADVIYAAKEEGLHPVQVMSNVGARCPAHCVATGKAILAFAPPADRARVVAAGLRRYTPLTHATEEAFAAEMARIQAQGVAVNHGEWRLEVRGVAAPLFDAGGRAIVAIGVCGPAERMSPDAVGAMVPVVTDVAARATRYIGGSDARAQ
ncbi:MAG TPA: IclR family transcriptional regulator [Thermomicrobiales bacterium]|jgi:DNA-binding IclR family transcriptional regulator|nr:IclR family transcriptional regulator [Thermomicrobiales bacterium]